MERQYPPFVKFLLHMEDLCRATEPVSEVKYKEIMMEIGKAINDADLSFKVDPSALTSPKLDNILEILKLPYKAGFHWVPGEEAGSNKAIQMTTNLYYARCDNCAIAADRLYKFMGLLVKVPSIDSSEFHEIATVITHLFNAISGCPFFVDVPNTIYRVDEINMLFAHRCIPFYIKSCITTYKGTNHHVPGYDIMRVKW